MPKLISSAWGTCARGPEIRLRDVQRSDILRSRGCLCIVCLQRCQRFLPRNISRSAQKTGEFNLQASPGISFQNKVRSLPEASCCLFLLDGSSKFPAEDLLSGSQAVVQTPFFGCGFFAYSWKLPAYSGAFLLTVDNFSFFAYSWSFFADSFSFFTYS